MNTSIGSTDTNLNGKRPVLSTINTRTPRHRYRLGTGYKAKAKFKAKAIVGVSIDFLHC